MYKLRFVSVDIVRKDFDMLEELEVFHEVECDFFTLEFVPGCEYVKLRSWNYNDSGPQLVNDQFEHIEEFEFEDMVTGDKFGLNAFNDLFWKLKK